jgi:hypothetical protein
LRAIVCLTVWLLAVNACVDSPPLPAAPALSPSETPGRPSPLPSTASPDLPPDRGSAFTTAPPLPEMPFENRLIQQGETYILQYRDAEVQIEYRYTPATGSLNDLVIAVNDEPPFLPSNYGGPRFVVHGEDIPIWESDPSQFTYRARIVDNTVLEVTWQAHWEQETIPYTYRFSIQGKTLRLEVASPSATLSAFTLDRSEETSGGFILSIPYLPLFNLLVYRQHFLSAYFDWQVTEASLLEKMNEAVSEQSLAFSQTAYYLPNTAGERRSLHEVVYLTLSDSLNEVLPRLPDSPSPHRQTLAGKVLLDLWAERPFEEDAQLLRELASYAVPDLIVVRHNWQNCGYDDCYPSVLPANPRWGGDTALEELSRAARQSGYLFAPHENYVDLYPNSAEYTPELAALDPAGTPVPAWFNRTTGIQSVLLSPVRSVEVARRFSPEIHRRYQTTAIYLDVSTAVNPSDKVDYNASLPGSARLRTALDAYLELLDYQRQAHQGPVIGEGGHHFLYAGAADAVIAEDAGREQAGALIPPIVHFDLLRIHPQMVRFGVGFYPWYFAQADQPKWFGYTPEEHYRYMASEIAFCHGGYIPTPDSLGDPEEVIAFIKREVELVAPIHRRCALTRPVRILYHVNGEMAGVERAILEDQPWQLSIEYEDGLQVWVNLHPTDQWLVTLPQPPSWVDFSALIDGQRQDGVGEGGPTAYLLPPAGWVAWLP